MFSGPSGSGKGTLLRNFRKKRGDSVYYSVSCTTRAPRYNERDGIDYYFVDRERFEQEIADDNLLEWAEYCLNYYGTLKAPVLQKLEQGIDVILEIEVQGACQVKKHMPEAVMIFNMAPSLDILEKRLLRRATEDGEVIRSRLCEAAEEIQYVNGYDYVIINNRLEDAAGDLEAIIRAEKCKTSRNSEFIKGVQNNA